MKKKKTKEPKEKLDAYVLCRLTTKMKKDLRVKAEMEGIKIQVLMTKLIEDYLK